MLPIYITITINYMYQLILEAFVYMPFLQKILKSKHNDFPEYYTEIELKNLTYKWDNVSVDKWIEFAEEHEIPYKNLYDDLKKKGL